MSEAQSMKPKSQMNDEERVRDLQGKLNRKAKEEPKFRFFLLYDKLTLPYILRTAYALCRKNAGAPGVDGVRFEDIERQGIKEWLEGLSAELKARTYKPQAVKRVYIQKENGKQRPLGIPVIRDRVAQAACKLVIEPIFEADFEDCSYGFRPGKSAHDAVTKIRDNLKKGLTDVYDADLSSFFDTIPHTELLTLVARRICDAKILHLIKLWLKAPVWEDGKISGGKKNKMGTPQGGVISPLLANIYLHPLDKSVNREGSPFSSRGMEIVRYADDFVLMAGRIDEAATELVERFVGRLKLKLNKEKTRVVNALKEPFRFLGFTFRYDKDLFGSDRRYFNVIPSDKSLKKVRKKIDVHLRTRGLLPPETVAKELNVMLRGWVNYFTIPKVSYPVMAKKKIRYYLIYKLWKFYCRKSQRKSKLARKGPYESMSKYYGLTALA